MTNLTPLASSVSLDDLLKSNKQQFDEIFAAQMTEIGLQAADRLPTLAADLESASLQAAQAAAEPLIQLPPPAETPAREKPRGGNDDGAAAPSMRSARPATAARREFDVITLDLIENALRNARHEMDAVLFRSAMSPVIREQHDEFHMITDPKGRMIVGQFGSYVAEMLAEQRFELYPGDVILQSDPYKCGGAISHINDWMVLVPVFHDGEMVGFTSMFGHMGACSGVGSLIIGLNSFM